MASAIPVPGNVYVPYPVTHLGLAVFTPTSYYQGASPGIYGIQGPTEYVAIPVDFDEYIEFLDEVSAMLESDEAPLSNPECKFCAYKNLQSIAVN